MPPVVDKPIQIDETALRSRLCSEDSIERLAAIYGALADPTRLRIVEALTHCELCVGDLASVLHQSQSTTSHHLRTLRALRLVRHRRSGRMVYYTLDDRHIHEIFRMGREHVEEAD